MGQYDMALHWIVFIGFATALFVFDVILTWRNQGPMGFRTSIRLTLFWVAMALLFNGFVWWQYAHWHALDPVAHPETGLAKAVEFLTGYLVEQSLSIDNLFVFLAIFQFMKVLPHQQPLVLKWGVFGAIVLRIIFVLVGLALIAKFHWIIYVFGVLILYAAWKIIFGGDEEVHPDKNIVYRLTRKILPIDNSHTDRAFFTRVDGKRHITPLFLTVMLILSTDIVFAVDSIPAILAITQDRYIVITSNIFAVMGLQAMFFAFSRMAEFFHYLKHGVGLVLVFIGLKMLLSDVLKSHDLEIAPPVSLLVVVTIIGGAIVASLVLKKKH